MKEVEGVLRSIRPAMDSARSARYHGMGRTDLEFLGLMRPQIREAAKRQFSFSGTAREPKAWDQVWRRSGLYEALSVALCWAETEDSVEGWPLFSRWATRISCWPHSDSLSSLYSRALEGAPGVVMPQLRKWSRSSNPWLRRQSIVSLIYYERARERVLPARVVLGMVEAQLDHPDVYVQKGVGWTLRECGRRYPRETLAFLRRRITRISGIAFQAATERIPAAEKAALKRARAGLPGATRPRASAS